MSVLVLQAFPGESGSTGSTAEQKATYSFIRRRPDEIANALKSEHRIEDEKRNSVDAVLRIRRSGSDERTHRAGFRDAFFQNLAVLRLLVIKESVHVYGLVQLADTGVDAYLAE